MRATIPYLLYFPQMGKTFYDKNIEKTDENFGRNKKKPKNSKGFKTFKKNNKRKK